jgi:isoleucyl-tRNA synthetase
MKYQANTRRRAKEYENDIVRFWKENKTFEKSVENRSKDNTYVFYDGPPFITGVPHHGTLLSSVVKDAVPRYQTMKGKRVERVWGWDCHGLPAENFVEKQLNIVDRRQIVTDPAAKPPQDKDGSELPVITLEQYITKARESMVANSATWESVIDRIGRWVDFKGAYRTMDKDFMESVWWAFKKLYDTGKIYEGEKVLMYDTKFATPVSKNEVTMDNDAYQTVTDPSVYAKFKLEDGSTLLAWTTTPWTLPGNTALAVNAGLEYSEIQINDEQFIMASELLERVLQDEKHQPLAYTVVRTLKGSELVGKTYQPLIPIPEAMSYTPLNRSQKGNATTSFGDGNLYKVWSADYVSAESGTGIVHIAPAYGEDDYELAKQHDVGMFHALDDNGIYYEPISKELYSLMPWLDATRPLEVWENNKNIAKGLQKAGMVWKTEYIRHEYPFNPRSKQRIMYRAIPSWFFDVQGSKPLMLEQNENINWFPAHLKHGRFEKNIEQAPDWNLSRDRFWATAMPVWKGDKGTVKVVGGYAELKELSGQELEDYHRPWVDDIMFEIDGEKFTRIDKVLDCWFESGSMPFAQFHYPFENKEKFETNFPGDFIVEYVGQVRAWFYYVHAVNTSLAEIGAFGADSDKPEKNAFKNVITTGVVAGNDGRKMSKSLGNFTDPNELMDEFSADSLRFLLLSSPLLKGEDFSLQDKEVGDVARKLSMIWNMYDFFTMYAEVDEWEWNGSLTDPLADLTNPLDIWIVSRLHQLASEVEKHMDAYNIPEALAPVLPFLDDASNWYVRRSRRRFWKSEDDGDKNGAYRTLHYVLVILSQVLAPFTPFLAEELYQKLTGGESVHLLDWPEAGQIDEVLVSEMESVREVINEGLGQRAKAGIKARQPLRKISGSGELIKIAQKYEDIVTEELNIKLVEEIPTLEELLIDTYLTPELKREGLMREVVRFVQNARKQADLQVDDRIVLSLSTDNEQLHQAITEYRDEIAKETLATSIGDAQEGMFMVEVKVEGEPLAIKLKKA